MKKSKPKLKKNTVIATGVTGIYKDKQIEVRIGETGTDTEILINNKKVNNCIDICIKIKPDDLTKIHMEFVKIK